MDGISLDEHLKELAPALVGRHLERPRLAAARAVAFEVSGRGRETLWLDVDSRCAGVYLLDRDEARRLEALAAFEPPSSRHRQALLILRKHANGVRVHGLRRIRGERIVVVDAGAVVLALRMAGAGSALTLLVEGAPLATLGDPRPVWPLPPDDEARDWPQLERAAVERELACGDTGRSPLGRLLARYPSFGPLLGRRVAQAPERLDELRRQVRQARPTLLLPEHEADGDASYAAREAVVVLPAALPEPGSRLAGASSWREAWQRFLELTRRGEAFASRRRAAEEKAARQLARLDRLHANLAADLAGLPDETALRREAEALLAYADAWRAGAAELALPDPYDAERRLRLRVDPALSRTGNAERRFAKARRVERSRHQIELRLRETDVERGVARERLAAARAARRLEELAPPEPPPDAVGARSEAASPRRYLTGHGLTLLVGRGAKENHHLTFSVARPEDFWLHARDVPGAHVILRDNEGRAASADLREAAEVAAFFSEARASAAVDVHVTRRKHVRPARGGPGRVQLGHSETLRVSPRDPEGRLRRR